MWIVFAIVVRIFWAGANAVNQLLARAHPRHAAIAGCGMELLGRMPFAVGGYFLPGAFSYNPHLVLYTFGGALSATLGLLPYYAALRHEHAYNVAPYLELTPVFLIFFAYLFKGETLTAMQLTGAALAIASGFLFSWDFMRSHFKAAIFAFLAAASLFFASHQYCLSQAELYGSTIAVVCGYYFGSGLIGVILFVMMRHVRETIIKTFIQTKGRTLFLALGTNILSLLGTVTLLVAFRLAPTLGHVAGLSGAQPIFSFLLALLLGKFFPKHFSKIIFDRETLAKTSLILVIAFGIYLLASP